MRYLMCRSGLGDDQPDAYFLPEFEAVRARGASVSFVDHDALVRGDVLEALEDVAPGVGPVLYRGWMLTPEQYAALHGEVVERGLTPITDPEAYRHCHHLPESYALIEAHTPRSVWVPQVEGLGTDRLMEALATFGEAAVILKDYVKSEKHDWDGACFIPSAASRADVERVVAGFLDWRGKDLNVGLVFREFVNLHEVGKHPQSGLPMAREFRVFVCRGEVLCWSAYWEVGDYSGDPPPLAWVLECVRAVQSPLFTVDVAQTESGEWVIVELGDGQVAGLPEAGQPAEFHARLASLLQR